MTEAELTQGHSHQMKGKLKDCVRNLNNVQLPLSRWENVWHGTGPDRFALVFEMAYDIVNHGHGHTVTYTNTRIRGWLTQRVLSDRSKALFAAGARVEPTTITMAIILHWPTALRRASNPDSAALVAASLSLLYSWLVSPDQTKITNTHTHWGQRKEHSESHPYSCPSFDIFIFIFIRP